jgi:hypothetical protein
MTLWQQPEGAGLEAIAEGFRHLGYADDHAINAAEWIVYDALYAYCQDDDSCGRSRMARSRLDVGAALQPRASRGSSPTA